MQLSFFSAFLLTNLLEMLVVYAVLRGIEDVKLILSGVFCFNIVTLPIVWFVFPMLLNLQYFQVLFISESFAFALEALGYLLIFRRTSKVKAVSTAIAANFLSFVVGLVVTSLA